MEENKNYHFKKKKKNKQTVVEGKEKPCPNTTSNI